MKICKKDSWHRNIESFVVVSIRIDEINLNGDNLKSPCVQKRLILFFLDTKNTAIIFLLEDLSSNVKTSCARGWKKTCTVDSRKKTCKRFSEGVFSQETCKSKKTSIFCHLKEIWFVSKILTQKTTRNFPQKPW